MPFALACASAVSAWAGTPTDTVIPTAPSTARLRARRSSRSILTLENSDDPGARCSKQGRGSVQASSPADPEVRMQRRRGVLASGTVALLATLGLSACGGSSGSDTSPKGELTAGISQLSDSDTLTTTVKLDTNPKDLQAFARASGDTLDAHAAGALASAQLVIENAKGSGSHRSYDVRAVDGGSTLV